MRPIASRSAAMSRTSHGMNSVSPVPAVASFIGSDLERIVEPGRIELRLGASSADIRLAAGLDLVGPALRLDHHRGRHCRVTVVTR